MLSPKITSKILSDAHNDNLTTLKQINSENPDFHWSALRYPKTGDTVLHIVARLGHLDSAQYLLSQIYQPSGIECKNNDDKTALHESCQFSHPEITELLITSGANVNALKRADWTPLMLACTKNCAKTIETLVKNSDLLVNYRNKDGWTACHLICRQGSAGILNVLLRHGLDWRIRTKNGRTALHIACLHGHLQIVEILLQLGLTVEDRDNCGNSALHEAVLGDNLDVLRVLLDKLSCKDSVFCVNDAGFNLLHLASAQGYCNLVKFLVGFKFDVNFKNCSGLSSLHCAARNGRKEAYDLLVRLGASESEEDKFGRTAKDYFLSN